MSPWMETGGRNPGPRLLLVDDEPHITHILGRKLSRLGAEVVSARNGSEALSMAIEHPPSLVLSDLQMPKINGLELALALAAHPATSTIPIVMISGRGFLLDDSRLEETNIVEVLEKPFSAKTVAEIVSRVLMWDPDVGAAA
ncbi:MAG: response regulator [Planctomycetota bacterium]